MTRVWLLPLLFLFPVAAAESDLSVGRVYPITFVDVDGNTFSTADGDVTTVVFAPESMVDRARTVGDRIPKYCLGNPDYRMVTVVGFQKKHVKPVRLLMAALIRRRLDGEGQRLQARYNESKISGNARRDVHAVADFDGSIATQLGLPAGSASFCVVVFGKNGQLLRQWSDTPTPEELAAVLK